MSTLAERIKDALQKHGKTQAGLARACKIKSPSVSDWVSGKTKKLEGANLVYAAQYLEVNAHWLATGTGPMTAAGGGNGDIDPGKYVFIPRLSVQVAAGNGRENHHVEIMETLAFRRDWLAKKGLTSDRLEVYEALGDSMSPYIENGDVVLVDINGEIPRNNEVWIIWQDGIGVRIKRLLFRENGDLIIRSDNPDKGLFPDEIIPGHAADTVRTIGKMVWRGG